MSNQALSLAEATARALAPLHNFLTLVAASSPEAAAVGQLALRDAANSLHHISYAVENRCTKAPRVRHNGFVWESPKCSDCAGCSGCQQ